MNMKFNKEIEPLKKKKKTQTEIKLEMKNLNVKQSLSQVYQ